MNDYFNKNDDSSAVPPASLSTPQMVIASVPDESIKGIAHRAIGKLGTIVRIFVILLVGGSMLAAIGFGGYHYVATTIAKQLTNPYDAINAADDGSPVVDTSLVAGSGSGGSAGATSGGGGSASSSGIGNSTTFTVQTPSNQNATHSVVSSAGFTHPGVMVSLGQLNTTKGRIAAGQAPWTALALQAKNSAYATKKPTLTGMVELDDNSKACNPSNPGSGCVVSCGYDSNPSFGCKDETGDAISAYTQALLWYYTGDETYAQSAVTILNGWSGVLRDHSGANKGVQTAWAAESFVRAAEIIRYTYTPSSGKTAFNLNQFNTMLQTAFVPILTHFSYAGYNGNWDLSAIDAKMDISVYTDNRALFNDSLAQWRSRVPAYIYLKSDGALPQEPAGGQHSGKTELSCFWLSNKADSCKTTPKTDPKLVFQNGQIQETCRDFGHVGMGLGSMLNTAETAAIQGVNLYGEQRERIMAGLSYTAEVVLAYPTSGYPSGFCDNVDLDTPSTGLPFEVAYNAYTVRGGTAFPVISIPGLTPQSYTNNDPVLTLINKNAASRSETIGLTTTWETLTHDMAGQ